MGAAAFVLGINMLVALIFSGAFALVAASNRTMVAPRWLALAYAMGVATVGLEFVLPWQEDARLVRVIIFLTFLLALAFAAIGLARHYKTASPVRLLVVLVVASTLINIAILDMPRDSLLRGILYQAPYALVQAIGASLVFSRRRADLLDNALVALFTLSALHYLFKPFLAVAIGSGGTAQGYIHSTYAAFSQASGAILLVSNGLLMLLVILKDVIADVTARSETDTLSGLLNRRGFEARASEALATLQASGLPSAIVTADLDHFKQINDAFGHAAGDDVITSFSAMLRCGAGERGIVGRMGGEEFVILLPGTSLATAQLVAEAVRAATAAIPPAELALDRPLTASFGVAQLRAGESLSNALRRADVALYRAKTAGRDRVSLWDENEDVSVSPPLRQRG